VNTRTLVILRHAKAERAEGTDDAERPLTDRGHADAAAAGAWLAHSGLRPDLVLCSPARRTRQTWHGVALGLVAERASQRGTSEERSVAERASGPAAPEVRYDPVLYGGSARTLLAAVRSVARDASTVLLIGHNPAVSDLSATLDPDGADLDGLRTAGIAVHTLSGDWTDLVAGAAALAAAHTARAD
jgi:phosphohistidine phosphatase